MRLELIVLPVSDPDRAREFYVERLGFHLDVDHRAGDGFRVIQVTPPGSHCSVSFGVGLSDMAPGSIKGLHLVVADAEAAKAGLIASGVAVSDLRYLDAHGQWQPGTHPDHVDYATFGDFADPDGNTWVLQERRSAPPSPPDS